MIIKQCQFSGRDDNGIYIHPVYAGYSNEHLIKQASISPPLIEEIRNHLKNMERNPGYQYDLVSALGAGEYWGSNNNGDYFSEAALIHTPADWHSLPISFQRRIGAKWEWGYPTFYNANPFKHHQNKDPARAFGEVEYVCWDPCMKRVLLILAIDRRRAHLMGAGDVVDKIDNGESVDVSMGCKVPYDVCSVCADWSRITGNAQKDLVENKKRPIRGLSVETHDYCHHLKYEVGEIYPDGRKVCMINLHPRFFDISFVYIGADKASKVMAKLAGHCPLRPGHKVCSGGCWDCDIPSSHVYDVWDRSKEASNLTKVASRSEKISKCGTVAVPKDKKELIRDMFEKHSQMPPWEDPKEEDAMVRYFKAKTASSAGVMDTFHSLPLRKKAEIIKNVRSHFKNSLKDIDTQEVDIPKEKLEDMSGRLSDSLSTAGSLGMVLKPREFQHSYLCALGKKPLSEELSNMGVQFHRNIPGDGDFKLSGTIIPRILQALAPLMGHRSAFGPVLHRRMVKVTIAKPGEPVRRITMDSISPGGSDCFKDHPLLQKIGAAYSDYRKQLMYKVASLVPAVLEEHPEILVYMLDGSGSESLVKTGSDVVQSILGMFPVDYLNRAYLPGPASGFIEEHPNLGGLQVSSELAERGGVA